MSKYLRITNNDEHQAIRLYIFNAQLSASMLTDLHYTEIALRNKFDEALAQTFGTDWFNNTNFRGVLIQKTLSTLDYAIREASTHVAPGQQLLPGKVVSELMFGFWHNLTNKNMLVPLWTPCLSKAFATPKPPARKDVHTDLDQLRKLRNRIAHHEPIFHLDLPMLSALAYSTTRILCPHTAAVMRSTSNMRAQLATLNTFKRRKKL